MRRVLLAAAGIALIAGGAPTGQTPAAADVVGRAGKYVAAYVEAFSAVVSEEKQTQKLVRPDGTVKKVRDITSDFLLVKTQSPWPEAFRDVIEVDGKPVKNRDDRLKKLFLDNPKSARELAQAIGKESGRYNLGPNRRGNSPLLPIIFLTPRVAPGVEFGGTASSLTFTEVKRPTVLARRTGNVRRDLPSRGTFAIEPGTGRVLAAEFTAEDAGMPFTLVVKVRYAIDPKLEISVPVEVTERYWQPAKPKEDVLEVRATYSAFRKFQVTTGEEIKK